MYTTFWRYTPESLTVEGNVIKIRPDLPPAFRNNPPSDKLFFDAPLDSRIYIASAKALDAYLSFGFNNIHATEASRYVDASETFRELYSTLSIESDSSLYVESTPNGQEGRGAWFYQHVMDAADNRKTELGQMALVFVPWQEMVKSFSIPFGSSERKAAFQRALTADERDLLKRFNFLQLEQLNWRRMMLAGPGFRGDEEKFDQEFPCLVFGTLVGTDSGIRPIEEVPIGALTTSGRVQGARPTGTHECVRVTTSMGYTIDCTLTHPIALAWGGFIPGGAALGKTIALQSPRFAAEPYTHVFQPTPVVESRIKITPDLARFLGYYMGDGSLYGQWVDMACAAKDQDVVADVERLMRDLLGKTTRQIAGSKSGCVRLRHNSLAARNLLLALGCGEMRNQLARRVIRVPDCIFRSPRPIVREFLRALFEAGGWVSKTNNNVKFFTKDERFSRDVQLLLLGFGIHSNRRRVVKKGTPHVGYELMLWSLDARAFLREIGFTSQRKTAGPVLRQKAGRRARSVNMMDTVVSVEPIGPHPVYDLDIADTHVFDANGILVHNTDLATAFLMSGTSVFTRKAIKRMMSEHVRPWIWEGDIFWGESDESNRGRAPHVTVREPHLRKKWEAEQEGRAPHTNERTYKNLRVWRWPNKGDRLFICCDVGEGKESTVDGDWSTIIVGCLNELERDEVIMTWRGHLNELAFAEVACALAWALLRMVGDQVIAPLLAPEWTGPGTAMCTYIDTKNLYPHLYRYRQPGVHKQPASKHVGWESNLKSVNWAMGYTRYMVERDMIDVPDERIVLEMSHYRQKDDLGDESSYGGAAGRHDDFVAAFRIMCALMRRFEAAVPGENEPVPIEDAIGDTGLPAWDPWHDAPAPGMPGIGLGDIGDEDDQEETLWYAS